MAVLTYTEITDLALDALQANTATNPPFTAAEILRDVNDAYRMVWEISGGSIKSVTGAATTWLPAPTTTTDGRLAGVLTDVGEILHLWASTDATSIGDKGAAVDFELDRRELSEIQWNRSNAAAVGSYAKPKIYAVTRKDTQTEADINKLRLDVWPGVAGLYFPMEYVPQFTPLNSTTIVTPLVNDLESSDIAYLAALAMAPRIGRAELAPAIGMKVSEKTQKSLERRFSALLEGKQDR